MVKDKLNPVLEKFLLDGNIPTNNTFIIKFSGDSTNITKSHKKILNTVLSLINDEENANAAIGQYSIGKLNNFFSFKN